MALTDIDFNEGEGQDFLLELPTGTLNAPVDILCEPMGSQFLVLETEGSAATTGDIFIIND